MPNIFFNVYLFMLREKGVAGGGVVERIPIRLHSDSREPYVGLKVIKHE